MNEQESALWAKVLAQSFVISTLAGAMIEAGAITVESLDRHCRAAGFPEFVQVELNKLAEGIAAGVEQHRETRKHPVRRGLRVIEGGPEPQ